MILQLLTGIHNLTTLLFGIFISAFFLGVKPIMKNFGKLLLFALVDVFFTGASTSLQARRLPISFTLFWYTFRSFYFCFCVTVIHFYPVVFLFFPPICAVSSATGSDSLHLRLLRIRSGTIAHELL